MVHSLSLPSAPVLFQSFMFHIFAKNLYLQEEGSLFFFFSFFKLWPLSPEGKAHIPLFFFFYCSLLRYKNINP